MKGVAASCLLCVAACVTPPEPTTGPSAAALDALRAGLAPWALGDGVKGDGGTVVLRMEPKDAEVFVDGVLQGTVEDFDGSPGGLVMAPGRRRLEVRKAGLTPYRLELEVTEEGRQAITATLAP